MTTAAQTRRQMNEAGEHWLIPLMDFVDDFRYYRDPAAVADPIEPSEPKLDALMASVVDYLCREIGIDTPNWVDSVPSCAGPWFVSGMESLKAITLAETPLPFRIRKVFVRDNFLSRA